MANLSARARSCSPSLRVFAVTLRSRRSWNRDRGRPAAGSVPGRLRPDEDRCDTLRSNSPAPAAGQGLAVGRRVRCDATGPGRSDRTGPRSTPACRHPSAVPTAGVATARTGRRSNPTVAEFDTMVVRRERGSLHVELGDNTAPNIAMIAVCVPSTTRHVAYGTQVVINGWSASEQQLSHRGRVRIEAAGCLSAEHATRLTWSAIA